ncbi:Dpse\GA17171-PA-like protein [Anopheles sinensis]|uniref:Dpse\GA17171-PA-like protein n=1 Tax=Anopheles sinensis TaxID=74873 RepID=A0A084VNF3_ANOSI|nr:Dpse\GA17171-PA-like protein [Anopheles sinensis]
MTYARQHCDALIKEEIEETPRSDADGASASPSEDVTPFDESTDGDQAALDDVREALSLRRQANTNHTEVPARQKPAYNASGGKRPPNDRYHAEDDEEADDDDDGERRVPPVRGHDERDDRLTTPLRDDDEDDEDEEVDAGSERSELDLKVDGRLSAIATTLDSEYHKRMAAAGVLAAAAAASAVSSMNGAAALGDAGSEQAAADFFAAHHKAGTHELALKQHFINEKVRLQALLQRQAQQQHQHHQKLAGFLLSTASTPPTPTLTPTNVLNLGQPAASEKRGGSQSPAITSGGRSSVTAAASGSGSGTSGSSSGSGSQSNTKQQSAASSVAAVAAAAAAADRLFAAAYNNTGSTNPSGGNATNSGSAGREAGNGSQQGQVYLLPCPLCEVPLEPRVFRQHLDRHYPRDSPVCPVIQCGRRFAHPNSVRNHMRLKHTNQWAQMKAMRSSGGPFTGIP